MHSILEVSEDSETIVTSRISRISMFRGWYKPEVVVFGADMFEAMGNSVLGRMSGVRDGLLRCLEENLFRGPEARSLAGGDSSACTAMQWLCLSGRIFLIISGNQVIFRHMCVE